MKEKIIFFIVITIICIIGITLAQLKVPFEVVSILFFGSELFLVKKFANKKKDLKNSFLLAPILAIILFGILFYIFKHEQSSGKILVFFLTTSWILGVVIGYLYSIVNERYRHSLVILFIIVLVILYFLQDATLQIDRINYFINK